MNSRYIKHIIGFVVALALVFAACGNGGGGRTVSERQVSAGGQHTCTVLQDGTVHCWGSGDSGELGNGSTSNSSTPVQVSNITNAIQVSAGAADTCAVLQDGTVHCWGSGFAGQLGNGLETSSSTPVQVSNITNATQVSTGLFHTCALLQDGTVRCWGGSGEDRRLGNGSTSNSSTPVRVLNITNATQVSAGAVHTCALLQDGTVHCWGNNFSGQLGNGSREERSPIPVQVSNITSTAQISARRFHTCAVLQDSTVHCWGGGGFGRLGNGIEYDLREGSPIPVQVLGIEPTP